MVLTRRYRKIQASDDLSGNTFSGTKSFPCVESAIVVGHKCTYGGRMPDEAKIKKIVSWPICRNLTEVRGFQEECRVRIRRRSSAGNGNAEVLRLNMPRYQSDQLPIQERSSASRRFILDSRWFYSVTNGRRRQAVSISEARAIRLIQSPQDHQNVHNWR